MKKTLYSTCLLILLMMGSSCNKWLDLEPRDGITRQEFWKTKEDVLAAVSGCYASLLAPPPSIGDRSLLEYMFMFGELRADMISGGPTITTQEVDIVNVNITADNTIANWAAFYRTINYCNTVLDYAPGVKSVDPTFTEATLNGYMAEALTLRSLMYFYLLRTFSDVPLKLTATVKDTDLQNLPKTRQADILKQIVADLKKAEQFALTTYGNTRSDKGRVTKFTVNALLADVYLWMEDYPNALVECNKIIDSQRFALVSSTSAWYNTVFFRGSSIETIFEFDQPVENPFFNLLVNSRRRYIASPLVPSEIFVPDETDPDNVYDIRPGSYYNSAATIQKYGTENPSYVKWQAYRISDIMMIKAEALALTGGGVEALELVNTLRLRRNAVNATKVDVDPDDTEALCDYILAERAREFAFEGKRWYDLLRHAKRNNYSRLDILLDMVSKTVSPTLQQSAITKFRDYNSHYLPILQSELFTNPNLVQNPFYTK
ncbi:RagB/SusD family nutrient uptake outer membrane protein [Pedobacter rhizosphaerae]|uniref:Starch-binding associating with outer membrane n=1 Tax=Pedobacter rhizosphaerae TaxID=390241 RepID=A0A1H9QLL6_9SPHI|nr:RagB/SusD family nutrient uptake outer membrane protein [Pedobacter rhizosphaerae]SER60643.1 Starch-binding associating with outer membrane [Pedobacter rhizosphaerae]